MGFIKAHLLLVLKSILLLKVLLKSIFIASTQWALSNCTPGPSRELWAVPPDYREAQVSHRAVSTCVLVVGSSERLGTERSPEHRAHNWGTKSAPRRLQAVFAQMLAQESHQCSISETASNPTLSKQGFTTISFSRKSRCWVIFRVTSICSLP